MLTNKGNQKGLFRGAIMQSGGPIPVGDIEDGQVYYDSMVENTRCGNATDTLECLRHIPYTTFKYAMDRSPDFMSYSVWNPNHLASDVCFTSPLGTYTALLTPCRWRLPDGASPIRCTAWPRV
jgi:carboxylesterase type B